MGLSTLAILCALLELSGSFFIRCSGGWTRFGNSCYKAYGTHKDLKTWQNAADACRGESAHLVVIESDLENRFVNYLLADPGVEQGNVWFGGTDLNEEGTWIWVDKGKPLRYTNWGQYEPNNVLDGENCLCIWYCKDCDKKWNDLGCDEKAHYVCEKPSKFAILPHIGK